jgi:hypothetical protein
MLGQSCSAVSGDAQKSGHGRELLSDDHRAHERQLSSAGKRLTVTLGHGKRKLATSTQTACFTYPNPSKSYTLHDVHDLSDREAFAPCIVWGRRTPRALVAQALRGLGGHK